LLEKTNEASRNHQFWADDLPLSALSSSIRRRLQGPKQITDAYLLALAMHHKAKLVTFDRRIEVLAPEGSAEREVLVILRP
jgi:predicted nucleic acid-binding protein